MRAVQLVAPQELRFVDVPEPGLNLASGEVLVRMEYLAVCGSDLKFYDRDLPRDSYPLPPGRPCHECVGIVEESNVPEFKPGQRVIALVRSGGLVERAAVPADSLVLLPDNTDVDPGLWVLCQPMGTVMYAVDRLGSVMGKRVVVVGAGPIGLCFTDLLARAGASQVIVTDVHDYRLDVARRVGATDVINAAREDVRKRIAEVTDGAMADVSIEACGLRETYQQVFDVIRQQGTVIIFGIPHLEDVMPFDWQAAYSKLPTIVVTNSAAAGVRGRFVSACVDMVANRRLDLSYLATHRFNWDDVPRAFASYAVEKDRALKGIIAVTPAAPQAQAVTDRAAVAV
ncbi:MAG: zinc-binding dehydrogenase [Chloroflexi bacterium]|nr:zinc-binding dehydrogenase [Chloroflexota bacterium]